MRGIRKWLSEFLMSRSHKYSGVRPSYVNHRVGFNIDELLTGLQTNALKSGLAGASCCSRLPVLLDFTSVANGSHQLNHSFSKHSNSARSEDQQFSYKISLI